MNDVIICNVTMVTGFIGHNGATFWGRDCLFIVSVILKVD